MGERCSDHTVSDVRTVYAKAIFAVGNTDLEQLPLEAIYNHEDYVDLISAQEFGIEALLPQRTLLCVAIALRKDALDDMERLITGASSKSKAIASAQVHDDQICAQIHSQEFLVPNDDSPTALCAALQTVPSAAWLAALGAWCTGYRVVLCGSKEML